MSLNNFIFLAKRSNSKTPALLPKSFDLSDLVTQAPNQSHCGSCYIFATVGMLEARMKWLYKDIDPKLELSV